MRVHEFCSTWDLAMKIHLKHLMEIWERWYIMQFLYEFFMLLIVVYLRWLSFKGWKIGQMIYSDGIKDGVIHTSLFLYLHAFIYTLVHTSLWFLGIVNEIMCIKDIWDTLKCPVSSSYYYRKQQSKAVKCTRFRIRSIGSRILSLPLIGCLTWS